MRTEHPLYNPFINRFNDPVNRRHDEMQCYENMVWLRERELCEHPPTQPLNLTHGKPSSHLGTIFVSLFVILVLIASFAVWLR